MKKKLLKIAMSVTLVGVMVLGVSTMSVEASVTTTTTTLTGDATISQPMFPSYDDVRADMLDFANSLYDKASCAGIGYMEDKFDMVDDGF